jgi:hypothetical protein
MFGRVCGFGEAVVPKPVDADAAALGNSRLAPVGIADRDTPVFLIRYARSHAIEPIGEPDRPQPNGLPRDAAPNECVSHYLCPAPVQMGSTFCCLGLILVTGQQDVAPILVSPSLSNQVEKGTSPFIATKFRVPDREEYPESWHSLPVTTSVRWPVWRRVTPAALRSRIKGDHDRCRPAGTDTREKPVSDSGHRARSIISTNRPNK